MKNWRDSILDQFIPNVSNLTLVEDPDGLLNEEKLSVQLRSKGFELIEFKDPIEFRYIYESKYRSMWDNNEKTDLVVILHQKHANIRDLPYDLLQAGKRLSFNLGDLFPNISYGVLDKLDRSCLDLLFEAQKSHSSTAMGENDSKDYILSHVFSIVPGIINTDTDLLRNLLKLHYSGQKLPEILAERLIQLLKKKQVFEDWDLQDIISDSHAFFEFLQERWPLFLKTLGRKHQVREERQPYGLRYKGKSYLPFAHSDIKIYIDNLFMEGKLTPINMEIGSELQDNEWIKVGIVKTATDSDDDKISGLFDIVEKNLPKEEARHSDWLGFAQKWAELCSAWYCGNSAKDDDRLKPMQTHINNLFVQWIRKNYSGLTSLPPTTPAMLHHIPRYLMRNIEKSNKNRVAIVVMDGLALDQWVTIRNILKHKNNQFIMKESAIFAWVPTLTSVSRQAIFAGKVPAGFPKSINGTHKEEKLWQNFWIENGLSQRDVAYRKSLGDGSPKNLITNITNSGKVKALGVVVDTVDKIMHGMQLGTAGMHNQVSQWCEEGFLLGMLEDLLDYGYDIWLTSDHGSIECHGRGSPSEGALAEIRGERVRVYESEKLRSHIAKDFDFAYSWEPVGLPGDYFPLVAGGSDAFAKKQERIVGHGGIAIEEVIVPFIKIERNTH